MRMLLRLASGGGNSRTVVRFARAKHKIPPHKT